MQIPKSVHCMAFSTFHCTLHYNTVYCFRSWIYLIICNTSYKCNVCVTCWQMSQTVLLLVRIWAVTGMLNLLKCAPCWEKTTYMKWQEVSCREPKIFCLCNYLLKKVFWWKPATALSLTNCQISSKSLFCWWQMSVCKHWKCPTHLCYTSCASLHAHSNFCKRQLIFLQFFSVRFGDVSIHIKVPGNFR